MLAVIDYGAGNLYSVCNSLRALEIPHTVTRSAGDLEQSSGIILPGVGAFGDAMDKLNRLELTDVIRQEAGKKPLLGICLGMQLLFERGYEFGETEGLGLIPGTVVKINAPGLKIPHMGWNSVEIRNPCPLTAGISDGEYFYFVHSFRADTADGYCSLTAEYGERIPALVFNGNVYGAQFHPEKSSRAGLAILRNFWELTKEK